MKCPVKVYLYNHIHPFFNPPIKGLPTLSQAFEEFLESRDWLSLSPNDGSSIKYRNGKAFTIQVDCDMARRWYTTYTEANRKLLMRKFNQYLEDFISYKGGYSS